MRYEARLMTGSLTMTDLATRSDHPRHSERPRSSTTIVMSWGWVFRVLIARNTLSNVEPGPATGPNRDEEIR